MLSFSSFSFSSTGENARMNTPRSSTPLPSLISSFRTVVSSCAIAVISSMRRARSANTPSMSPAAFFTSSSARLHSSLSEPRGSDASICSRDCPSSGFTFCTCAIASATHCSPLRALSSHCLYCVTCWNIALLG